MDAAAALRRAAECRHELELVGLVRGQPGHFESHRADRTEARGIAERQGGEPALFGVCRRAGHCRPRQQASRSSRAGPLGPVKSGPRQRRGQPFRFAVQLPRGVRRGLSAPSARAGHHRVPPDRKRPERHRQADPGHRHLPRQGDRANAGRRTDQLGIVHGAAAAWSADAAQPSAVPAEHRPAPAHRQQARRGRARPHPRPRTRRAAVQRIPPPDRPQATHQLRRFRRPAALGDARGVGRAA